MIDNALIPNRGGVWIDAYSQSIMEDKAGTITTKVSDSNNYYVTDIQPINALRGGGYYHVLHRITTRLVDAILCQSRKMGIFLILQY